MTEDQSQGPETAESEEPVEESTAEAPEDNQEVQDQTKSNTSESGDDKSNLYTLPDGRELPGDKLLGEYKNLQSEFTKRSQKLKQYEREQEEATTEAKSMARKGVEQDDLLKDVPADVKEAIVQITSPLIENRLQERDQKIRQQQQDEAFREELSRLEEKFDGSDGLPKFDRDEVLSSMQDETNRIFDPETKFRRMYEDEFQDYIVKKALKKQGSGTKTEKTGGGSKKKKPERKEPSDFTQARKALTERLLQSE